MLFKKLNILFNLMIQMYLMPSGTKPLDEFSNTVTKKTLHTFIITLILSLFIFRIFGKTLLYLPIYSFYHLLVYSLLSTICDVLFLYIVIWMIKKIYVFYSNEVEDKMIVLYVLLCLLPLFLVTLVVNIFPSLMFMFIFGLYGLFVGYNAMKNIFRISKDRQNVFFVISIFIFLSVYLILRFAVINPFFDLIF